MKSDKESITYKNSTGIKKKFLNNLVRLDKVLLNAHSAPVLN